MTEPKDLKILNSKFSTRNSSATMVRLRKPHPCGGTEFTVVREGPVVTLRCLTCGSFIRLEREKYEKAVQSLESRV